MGRGEGRRGCETVYGVGYCRAVTAQNRELEGWGQEGGVHHGLEWLVPLPPVRSGLGLANASSGLIPAPLVQYFGSPIIRSRWQNVVWIRAYPRAVRSTAPAITGQDRSVWMV
ncbi:hypothetical protein PoB_006191400 [Plakobranchus ocellatus]|uniref:Uncharacterized protein n=1 Tax=Plakobranchus ocellatus TaxID=259542 RepID=A0AAV4CU49_9GAST|nr:hypothetical protein PoB_006191400 [Plakobranchus ocellatus]